MFLRLMIIYLKAFEKGAPEYIPLADSAIGLNGDLLEWKRN